MKFLDQVKVFLRSGDGGAGVCAFHRAKFIEFGGPDGGDGGRGGDVVLEAVDSLNTLIDFRYRQHFKAEPGRQGAGENRTGAHGADALLKVPVGTAVLDEDGETLLADLTRRGQRVVLLKGGDGGFGNAHYKTSTNRSPRRADPGWPGQERWVWLRLKLIADVGLVGLPNAGKSTFLAACTRARPKIADYPFTTLHPNLGVAHVDEREFILADIPGLIEGAHEGAGLGTRFLGHVERCRVLLHLVDATAEDVVEAFRIVRGELKAYGAGLWEKPQIVALNKIDAVPPEELAEKAKRLARSARQKPMLLSGVTGVGVTPLLRSLRERIDSARAAEPPAGGAPAEEAAPWPGTPEEVAGGEWADGDADGNPAMDQSRPWSPLDAA